ncbi:MAG: hypothetical protein ABI277_12105 [Burkholderiaceae bacterium]
MEKSTPLSTFITFLAAVVVGCGAAVAIASTAAVSQVAPSLRPATQTTPQEVIRLAPVVVTISKNAFDGIRNEARSETELAGANAARKVTRG